MDVETDIEDDLAALEAVIAKYGPGDSIGRWGPVQGFKGRTVGEPCLGMFDACDDYDVDSWLSEAKSWLTPATTRTGRKPAARVEQLAATATTDTTPIGCGAAGSAGGGRMTPLRTIKVTTGKSAAYSMAAELRARGAQVTTVNVHGQTYEVRIYKEPMR